MFLFLTFENDEFAVNIQFRLMLEPRSFSINVVVVDLLTSPVIRISFNRMFKKGLMALRL